MKDALLEIESLSKDYRLPGGLLGRSSMNVRAVDRLSLCIRRGETLGLVGESGCGKSTLGRLIALLERPSAGTIRYGGQTITALRAEAVRGYRRKVQMVFQDPYASLNPRMTAASIIGEPLWIHHRTPRLEREERVSELMQVVGLNREQGNRYPHEFSGGQRQRIGIARALVLQPELIIADEPVSSLDVSIQAQILNLLKELQRSCGLTYLFIAHDLAVVRHMSDRIAVMYLGRIVEWAEAFHLCNRPRHPYTQALIEAVPAVTPKKRLARAALCGEISSTVPSLSGCPFHTRCPHGDSHCEAFPPALSEVAQGHWVACHRC